MDTRGTMLDTAIDVTLDAWLAETPAIPGTAKACRAAYNTWAHQQMQEAQRNARMVDGATFAAMCAHRRQSL